MRLSYSKEDLIIGFFIVFAISYPFITALLIFLQDMQEKRHETEEVRSFYSFLLGQEECTPDRAQELSRFMSEDLSEEMGGAEGLLRTCQSYRRAYPNSRVEEKVVGDGQLLATLVRKEKGIIQRSISVKVYYKVEDKNIKIERLEYEKGS